MTPVRRFQHAADRKAGDFVARAQTRRTMPRPSHVWRLLALPLVMLALLLAGAGTARADSIVVTAPDDGGGCTLRSAIASANTDTAVGGCTAGNGADTITFDANQTGSLIILAGSELPLTSTLTIDSRRCSNIERHRRPGTSVSG